MQACFQPLSLFYHCADRNSGHWGTVSTLLGERSVNVVRRARPRGRVKMKTLLITGALVLVLSVAGCSLSPTPAAQGPPGPQGQTGQTGQPGDPGQSGQQGQVGDPGQTGDAGRQGREGREGKEGREGREGQDAPCPAGEHRHTNQDTGKPICVRD
jgi:hypothetical protein